MKLPRHRSRHTRNGGFRPAALAAVLAVMPAMLMSGVPPSMAESPAPAVEPAVNTAPPAVSAAAGDPQTLTASTGSWVGSAPLTYSYQWQRCTLRAANWPGSGPGQLLSPEGIAVDAHGDVWVSDTYHGRLEVFSAAGKFLKTVGTQGSGPGRIGEPEGIAIDSKGDVWVADWRDNTVDVFKEDGTYVRQLGGQGSGDGELHNPYGVAVDSHGHVWVGDVGNNRVEEFTENGEYVSQFGSRGTGPGQFGLSYPVGLAVDSKGNLWVTDTENKRLEEFNEAGEYVGQLGAYSYGSGGAAAGVAVGPSDRFWVVAPRDAQLTQFNRYGGYERQFGSQGAGAGQLNRPGGVAVGPKGEVWVIDTGNNRLAKFSEQGALIPQQTCVNIPGATGPSYATGVVDLGSEVQVVVTATNGAGSASAAGPASTTGSAAEPPTPTSAPSISGTARDGQALTAGAGQWAGTEPLVYAYQWQRCSVSGSECANLEGATGPTYTLGHGDVGATLRVAVTASNPGGSRSANSAVTAIVAPLNTPFIIGVNDAIGWGPADAARFLADGITSGRASQPDPYGNSAQKLQEAGFTQNTIIVGNTPDGQKLSSVDQSSWVTTTAAQVKALEPYFGSIAELEVINEPYLKGGQAQPSVYAAMYVALSEALEGIKHPPLGFATSGDYRREDGERSQMAVGNGWVADALKAQPSLKTRIEAFVSHPYGRAHEDTGDHEGPGGLEDQHAQAVSLGIAGAGAYYLTEFGIETAPCANKHGYTGSGVCTQNNAQQAEWIKEAYAEFVSLPYVKGVWYYQTHDDSSGKWGLIEPQESGASPFVARPSLEVVSSFAREY